MMMRLDIPVIKQTKNYTYKAKPENERKMLMMTMRNKFGKQSNPK
jgi:hypothetical protein